MKIKVFGKYHSSAIFFCLFILLSFILPSLYAQDMTHVVKKGDTLWDICEKYYGDPDLWPKLWQMNPYITNPHLLKPGDIVVLFEKPPVKEAEAPVVEKEAEKIDVALGINVEGITEIDTIGFLSLGNLDTSGTIISSESTRLALGKGDFAYTMFEKGIVPKTGDEYIVIERSSLLKDPTTNKKLGYTFTVHGRLVIKEQTGEVLFKGEMSKKENIFIAEIVESFEPVVVGDEIIPYEPISSCVLPEPAKKDFVGNIVATQNQLQIFTKGSIVYLNRGFNHGIRRGNLFDVVRINIMKDPNPDQEVYPVDRDPILILPDIPVGALLVLEARPNTSTALVIHAEEEMENGAYITTMGEERYSNLLSLMAKCPLE